MTHTSALRKNQRSNEEQRQQREKNIISNKYLIYYLINILPGLIVKETGEFHAKNMTENNGT